NGWPWRGRTISGGVSLRMRGTTGFARICAADGVGAWRCIQPAGIRSHKPEKHFAKDASGLVEVPVSKWRLRLLAGRLLLDVAIPHVVHPSRLQPGGAAHIRARSACG